MSIEHLEHRSREEFRRERERQRRAWVSFTLFVLGTVGLVYLTLTVGCSSTTEPTHLARTSCAYDTTFYLKLTSPDRRVVDSALTTQHVNWCAR